jgi:hypothetical protein
MPYDAHLAREAYRHIIEEQPAALADLYIDFYDFRQVEFLIFKNRLSAAVLISNAASRGIYELMSKFEAKREDGSYLISGWESESELALSEALTVTNDAHNLSIGATIVTAVAALESLLIDLTPDSELRGRRNTFAHSLTGSYLGDGSVGRGNVHLRDDGRHPLHGGPACRPDGADRAGMRSPGRGRAQIGALLHNFAGIQQIPITVPGGPSGYARSSPLNL